MDSGYRLSKRSLLGHTDYLFPLWTTGNRTDLFGLGSCLKLLSRPRFNRSTATTIITTVTPTSSSNKPPHPGLNRFTTTTTSSHYPTSLFHPTLHPTNNPSPHPIHLNLHPASSPLKPAATTNPHRQFYENYISQSCDGLALPFLVNWLAGDVTNLVGCVLTDQKEFQVSGRAERAGGIKERASKSGLSERVGVVLRVKMGG